MVEMETETNKAADNPKGGLLGPAHWLGSNHTVVTT